MSPKTKIVSAVGTSASAGSARSGGKGPTVKLSAMIEKAMSDAVLAAQKDSEKVWARKDIDDVEKRRLSDALTAPDAIRARMQAGREAAKAAHAKMMAKA